MSFPNAHPELVEGLDSLSADRQAARYMQE